MIMGAYGSGKSMPYNQGKLQGPARVLGFAAIQDFAAAQHLLQSTQ